MIIVMPLVMMMMVMITIRIMMIIVTKFQKKTSPFHSTRRYIFCKKNLSLFYMAPLVSLKGLSLGPQCPNNSKVKSSSNILITLSM